MLIPSDDANIVTMPITVSIQPCKTVFKPGIEFYSLKEGTGFCVQNIQSKTGLTNISIQNHGTRQINERSYVLV